MWRSDPQFFLSSFYVKYGDLPLDISWLLFPRLSDNLKSFVCASNSFAYLLTMVSVFQSILRFASFCNYKNTEDTS
jgi:hypothetical protein